jgi:hypothetical protein
MAQWPSDEAPIRVIKVPLLSATSKNPPENGEDRDELLEMMQFHLADLFVMFRNKNDKEQYFMKCLPIWMAMAMAVFGAYGQSAETTAAQVNCQAPTCLCGGQASSVLGDIPRQDGDFYRWWGSGCLIWEVWVNQPGAYEVKLCHAAEPDGIGQQLKIIEIL